MIEDSDSNVVVVRFSLILYKVICVGDSHPFCVELVLEKSLDVI